MSDSVTLQTDGDVAIIRIDDGKANALGHAVIDGINAALDDAADAGAVVVFGRPGKFSAGFDLRVMQESMEAAQALTRRGADLCMRLFGFPRPVLAGSDGHALAAGALVLLSCDVRIGSDTPGKIGLPEVTIGMPLPYFACQLAEARVSKRHLTAAALLGTTYSPEQATDVGFLDRVVPLDNLESTVLEAAATHAATLSRAGFAQTRVNVRQAVIDRVLAALDDDMASFRVDAG